MANHHQCTNHNKQDLNTHKEAEFWIFCVNLQGARELKRFVHPNLVYPIKWGKNVLDERVIGSIWAFFSAYLLVFTICLLSVIACGIEPFDAFNAVLASINNLGPGLGSVSSNMTAMPDSANGYSPLRWYAVV